jgi:general secretion pathway protein M
MTQDRTSDSYLARHPVVAVTLYLAAIGLLASGSFVALADIADRRAAVAAMSELLTRLEGRVPQHASDPSSPPGPAPAGSPFLEGQTVTVAGAALLQRVATTVTRLGGSVLSSQVDVAGPEAKNGYVNLIVSCEIEQAALQALLYDLESGMPFLFIEQLVAQAPTNMAAGGERLRLLLAVSGMWPGAK